MASRSSSACPTARTDWRTRLRSATRLRLQRSVRAASSTISGGKRAARKVSKISADRLLRECASASDPGPAELHPPLDGRAPVLLLVKQEEESAAKIPVRDPTSLGAAAPEFGLETEARDATQPEAGLDGALERLGVLQGQRDVEVGKQAAHGPVESLPGARASLPHDPGRLA